MFVNLHLINKIPKWWFLHPFAHNHNTLAPFHLSSLHLVLEVLKLLHCKVSFDFWASIFRGTTIPVSNSSSIFWQRHALVQSVNILQVNTPPTLATQKENKYGVSKDLDISVYGFIPYKPIDDSLLFWFEKSEQYISVRYNLYYQSSSPESYYDLLQLHFRSGFFQLSLARSTYISFKLLHLSTPFNQDFPRVFQPTPPWYKFLQGNFTCHIFELRPWPFVWL